MKYILFFLFFPAPVISCFGQTDLSSRIILIGDAGEMTADQVEALNHAAQDYVMRNQTTVFFLGDNIYPDGMALEGTPEQNITRKILRSQFEPMLNKQASVYFIPGNHDWTRSDIIGLKKIKAAGEFIEEQANKNLKMVPSRYGCPDPEAIQISDSVTVIAYDSQWWLLRERTDSSYNYCKCKSEQAVIRRMEQLRDENKGKIIILASHHPFQSYGNHGGRFCPVFYVIPPLQAYPILRPKLLIQDLKHPRYQNLIREISNVFYDTPGVIYAAGHEHGLQLINDGKHTQIVSGAGAKRNYIKHHGAPQIFAENSQGFVVMDLSRSSRIIKLTYVYFNLVNKQWIEMKWSLDPTGQLKDI